MPTTAQEVLELIESLQSPAAPAKGVGDVRTEGDDEFERTGARRRVDEEAE